LVAAIQKPMAGLKGQEKKVQAELDAPRHTHRDGPPLERRGWSVWWDRVLKPGETWPQVIERELNAAHCVVVAWSKSSIGSPWVRLEANRARVRHNMVPVILDDASVPPEFAVYQSLDMRDGAEEQKLQQLGDGVAQKLRGRRLRLTGITAGLVAAVALIIAGGMIYTAGVLVLRYRKPDPSPKWFGYHEVWHVATIGAAVCFYIVILLMLLKGR
jgi:hypothetical protein